MASYKIQVKNADGSMTDLPIHTEADGRLDIIEKSIPSNIWNGQPTGSLEGGTGNKGAAQYDNSVILGAYYSNDVSTIEGFDILFGIGNGGSDTNRDWAFAVDNEGSAYVRYLEVCDNKSNSLTHLYPNSLATTSLGEFRIANDTGTLGLYSNGDITCYSSLFVDGSIAVMYGEEIKSNIFRALPNTTDLVLNNPSDDIISNYVELYNDATECYVNIVADGSYIVVQGGGTASSSKYISLNTASYVKFVVGAYEVEINSSTSGGNTGEYLVSNQWVENKIQTAITDVLTTEV